MSDLEPGVVLSPSTVAAMEPLGQRPAAKLSPATQAIWDAYNQVADRVGMFEDYGDALAAALRAAADHLGSCNASTELLALAAELDMQP